MRLLKAVRNATGRNRDVPGVLVREATALNCELVKVDTGTCKTSNLQKKKKMKALICRGEAVVLDG